MNTLSLAPELAASLADCEVGSEETIEVTLKVTKNDESGFEGTVTSAGYVDAGVEEEEVDEEVSPEDAATPKKKGPAGNPAIMLVLGKPSK